MLSFREYLFVAMGGFTVFLLALPAQNTPMFGKIDGDVIHKLTYSNWFQYGGCPASKCINGDTYISTWADDDVIYVQSCDTFTFNNASSANFFIGSLDGYTSTVTGTNVNFMSQFGTQAQTGSDGASYKSSSLASIQGKLYMFANRQGFPFFPGWISSQIIKSTDHGANWTPLPPSTAQPYVSPMFTDPKFSVPFFFQYGKDYVGQTADRSSEFVYASSLDQTSGHFDTDLFRSDRMFLGRVAVSSISNLSASDWQYYQGGDGSLDTSWGALSTAVPTITETSKILIGQGTVAYLPAFGQYLMWNFHETLPPSGNYDSIIWGTYKSPHPWGPWTLVQSDLWDSRTSPFGPGGNSAFNYPAPVLKSIVPTGGRTFTLFTNGNFVVSSQYTLVGTTVTVE
jgi:hypothetical protein